MGMLREQLRNGEFEFGVPLPKLVFYNLERLLGNTFFKKYPPRGAGPRLLNLGCGPVLYEGWVNADEYAFKRALRERAFKPDWRLDITQPWKCKNDFWDGIFTQHVLEHVPYSAGTFTLDS